jgi:hypothetical protein
MIRHAALVAVLVCGSPSWICAQSTEFTVNEPAEVHKGPSTINPVIGKAPRGTVLKVTRELGSWVRISWPAAEDGVGFVQVSMGRISHGSTPASNQTGGPTTRSIPSITSIAGRQAPASASPATTGVQGDRSGAVVPPAPGSSVSIPHLVGLGGRMGGSTLGLGVSARAAVGNRFGIQLEVSRYSLTSAVAQQSLSFLEFAPSLIYSLPDRVTDYVWVRPYVGAGLVSRSTLGGATPAAGASVTDNRLGRQAFAGAEVSHASVPRFTLSADYGYRWAHTPISVGGVCPCRDTGT